MQGFERKNTILHAESVSLEDIARVYGTPSYVYSAGHMQAQFERLQRATGTIISAGVPPLLCYACKANSNLAVLSWLRSLGSGLEIVSEGELHRGLKAGFKPETIVSTGVGKQASEIAQCLKAGILQMNVESIPELELIHSIAVQTGTTARVVFRLNPDVSGGGHHKISTGRKRDKFGLSRETIFKAYEMAKAMDGVEAIGLSMHIGSQVFNVETFREVFQSLPALVKELRAAGHQVLNLDIGGGFPIQYDQEELLDLDAYASWVRDFIAPLDVKIILEPGRYLVGNAGVLLTRVLYVKETAERSFLVLDAAMNDLIRPTLYDAYHGIEPVAAPNSEQTIYDVVGPICETGDTFSTDRELPVMKAGDLAVIRSAGAYGFCMSSNYNTRPRPPEIFVHDSAHSLIRPRETYDDLLNRETVPDWIGR